MGLDAKNIAGFRNMDYHWRYEFASPHHARRFGCHLPVMVHVGSGRMHRGRLAGVPFMLL